MEEETNKNPDAKELLGRLPQSKIKEVLYQVQVCPQ